MARTKKLNVMDREEDGEFSAYRTQQAAGALRSSARRILKLVPDAVMKDLAKQEFEMHEPNACLCGWALKLGLEKARDGIETAAEAARKVVAKVGIALPANTNLVCTNEAMEQIETLEDDVNWNSDYGCQSLFGGDQSDWSKVYSAVCDAKGLPIVEQEVFRRIAQIKR